MKKILIVGHKEEKEKILKSLATFGAVEITAPQIEKSEAITNEIASLTKKLNRTKTAIEVLNKFDNSKKSIFSEKLSITDEEIFSESDQAYAIVKEINKNYEEMEHLKSNSIKLQNEKAKIEPYINSTIPINTLQTKTVYFETGFFSKDFLENEMLEEMKSLLITPYFLSSNNESSYYTFVVHKSNLEIFSEISKKYGFSKMSSLDENGKISEIISIYNTKIENSLKKSENYFNNITVHIPKRDEITKYYDIISTRLEIKKAEAELQSTNATFILNGYIPKSVSEKVKKILTDDFICAIYLSEVPDGEEFPIKVSNHSIIEPYEMITEMYSLPSSKGIDPSMFMAPFYFIFFGMMLSDSGYGLIMSILTGIIILKFKPEGFFGKITKLLFMCGISTIFWGMMFGSFFANITEVAFGIPTKPLWFNPMEEPIKLLTLAYILGALHIITGMALKAYMLIRDGKILDAIFDVGGWYLVFIGIGMLFSPYTSAIGGYVIIVAVIMLILTQGRSENGIAKKLTTGILSLYDITAYLSDILSYSRLLALGLATSVIGMVINIMGGLGGKNFIGYIVLIVVFIFGHTFNILINILGSYVHSSRLMYIEFFGKFFESGGKIFKPLKLNSTYSKLLNRKDVYKT